MVKPRSRDTTLHQSRRHGCFIARTRALHAAIAVLATGCTLLLTTTSGALAAPSDSPLETWQPNGPVNSIVQSQDGNRAFIGGSFTYLGPRTGAAVRVGDDGRPTNGAWPSFGNGTVTDIVDDGSGGWFVAGNFLQVDGASRPNLAHVTSAGLHDPTWVPVGISGPVAAIARNGTRLYVAGSFGSTQVRALTVADGSLDNSFGIGGMITTSGGDITALHATPTRLYVAGDFVSIGGASRVRLAALTPTGAVDVAFDAGTINDVVTSVVASGPTLYVGGSFTTVNGTGRSRVAAVNSATGVLDATFNPAGGASSTIEALAIDPGTASLYVGGAFGTFSGATRNRLAKLNAVTGALDNTFAPAFNGSVLSLDINASGLLVGGSFTTLDGAARLRTARLDPATGVADPAWNVAAEESVLVQRRTPGGLVIGGAFNSFGGAARTNLAAIDLATGEATGWAPKPTFVVHAITESAGVVYVGGAGAANIAAYRAVTAAPDPNFTPPAISGNGNIVRDIVVNGNVIVIGGSFDTVGAASRHGIAGLNLNGAVLAAWPTTGVGSNTVYDLDLDGTDVVAAGSFTTLNGTSSPGRVARIRPVDGAAYATWFPSVDGTVTDISISGTTAHIAGSFTYVNSTITNGLATIWKSGAGGGPPSINPVLAPSSVNVVQARGSQLYVGGTFNTIDGQVRNALAAINEGDGTLAGWQPQLTSMMTSVNSIDIVGSTVVVGGDTGIAVYRTINDTLNPSLRVTGFDEVLPGIDPNDGTFTAGPSTIYVRTSGVAPEPTFTAHATAFDPYASSDQTYAGASGIKSVGWGGVHANRGVWMPASSKQPGAPRGLKLQCWNNDDPGTGPVLGTAIDRAIDYAAPAHRPDQLPALPATIAAGTGLLYNDFDDSFLSFEGLSCRWQGFVIPADSWNAGSHRFRGRADNGIRVDVGGQGALPAPWSAVDFWNSTGQSPESSSIAFAAEQVRPVTVEWWDQSGSAEAVLEWDKGSSGVSWEAVPEAAFVTRVDYQQQYSFVSGTPLAGSSSVPISATDHAGRAVNSSFDLITDDIAPSAATFTTLTGAWSTGASIDLHVTDSTDSGSGIFAQRVERRVVPFQAGTGACDLGHPAVDTWVPIGASLVGAPSVLDTTDGPLTNGCVQYRVISIDNVGNQHVDGLNDDDALASWIHVDTTPPDLTGSDLSYDDGWTNAPSIDVAFAVPTDPESGLDPAATWIQQDVGTLSGGVCGSWSGFTNSPPYNPVSPMTLPLSSGSCYRYRLVYANHAGAQGVLTLPAMVKVDATMPSGSFTSFGPLRTTATITGVYTDMGTDTSGLATYDVSFTGPGHPTPSSICSGAAIGGGWSCGWDTTGLTDGVYSVTATITDIAGNAFAVGPNSFQVDNTAPTITVMMTGLGADAWADPTPGLLWVNTANAGSMTFESQDDDWETGVMSAAFSSPAAGWTIGTPAGPSSTLSWIAGALDPGPITRVAYDYAGNTASLAFDVRRDVDAPTGTTISQTTGLGSVPTITSSSGVDAGSGIDSAELLREQTTRTGATCDAWIGTPTTLLGATIGVWTDTTVTSNRCYRYSIRVVDHVGNARTVAASGEFMTDEAGIEILPAVAGLTQVSEGASLSYLVRLRTAPTSNVTIDLTADGQVQASPAQLVFTPTSWSTQRTVTVTGVDDPVDEASPMNATVTYAIAPGTLDIDYAVLGPVASTTTVLDNDIAAVQLGLGVGNAISLAEADPAGATYTVRLGTRPHGTVTIAPGGGEQVAVAPATLTFDAATWSTVQTVTVTPVDDALVEGPHSAAITHAITAPNAGDSAYASLSNVTVPIRIADDDVADLSVQVPVDTLLDEADAAATKQVLVRLSAQPDAAVSVAATAAAGQLVAEPAALSFTPENWSTAQPVAVHAAPDTLAEPTPHAARLQLTTTSPSPAWAALAPQYVQLGVRDDDAAAFTTSPGPRWTLDDDGKLQLDEAATQASILRIRTVGDPSSNVTITPKATAAGQLEVTPSSVTIPAGSHEQVVSFAVRAVNDREAESAVHSAKVAWKVQAEDPLYAAATMPNTFARIKDASKTTLREDTGANDPGTKEPSAPDPNPTSTGPTYTGPTNSEPQQPSPDPDGRTKEPLDGGVATGETVGDSGADDARDETRRLAPTSPKDDPSATDDDADDSLLGKPVKRFKQWAGDHKAKAAVGVSAAGTAAIWAFKPAILAGKALGGGGGIPHPPGITQLRHLLKRRNLRRIRHNARRLRRLKKGRPFDDDDDDDWDDLLWGDRAA